mgnify:CR=1 FL=1
MFPLVLLLLFMVKGRYYNPDVYLPPALELAALPVPMEVGEWILGNAELLPADRMFEKINGKAAYYLQYGAVELCSGEWALNGQRWDMYLYHFESDQGALGAYNGERPSEGSPIEGVEGYAMPGQAAMVAGGYYLQLNALAAEADAGPAIELARSLMPHLQGDAMDSSSTPEIDLVALAGERFAGEAEEFIPENAFGFSVLDHVRAVDVMLNDAEAVWFSTEGDAQTVQAYHEELAMYGGEGLFTEDGASGGSMFGTWSVAGVLNGAVWGVQNALSRDELMRHWSMLQSRLNAEHEAP